MGPTRRTADADHPACVVVTYREAGRSEDFVLYLPISHTAPMEEQEAIEIPEAVRQHAGLGARRQWIYVSEANLDVWPQDLRLLPGARDRFHHGYRPPGFFRTVRDRFLARFRERRLNLVRRETP